MIELRDGPRFPFEPVREVGVGDVDGNGASQASVASVVDLAHASGANRLQDLVRAELFPAIQAHKRIPANPSGFASGREADDAIVLRTRPGRKQVWSDSVTVLRAAVALGGTI